MLGMVIDNHQDAEGANHSPSCLLRCSAASPRARVNTCSDTHLLGAYVYISWSKTGRTDYKCWYSAQLHLLLLV